MDFTRVGGLFRSVFVGAVLDAFSRKGLALRVCVAEPTAAVTVRLLREAAGSRGPSRWMITDRGRQFTSAAFTRALARRGVRRRYGAGRTGSRSLARIDLLRRTRGLFLYRPIATIERQMRSLALW